MRVKLPKHVHGFVDRHGKSRHYLRVPGQKPVPLPGPAHSLEFMAAYQTALSGIVPTRPIGAGRTQPGTVNAAIVAYYGSEAWAQLRQGTQRARRNILELFREEHGDKRISKLSSRPLIAILSQRKVFAAHNW